MKILLLLILVFVSLVAGASAQLCGTYGAALIITDESNKPIENVKIKIVSMQKEDYTQGKAFVREKDSLSQFSISFNEGYKVIGNYKIIVSAKGYIPEEKEIKFPHCEKQKFEIKLKAENLSTLLTGTVFDLQGAVIPGIVVRAYSEKGLKYEDSTNSAGVYELKLAEGVYKVQFCSYNFETLELDKYRIVSGFIDKMNLDVSLSPTFKRITCNPFNLTSDN